MANEIENTPKKRGRPPATTETKPAKQKRNRPDLAKFGQEHVEAGDNAKYLNHELAVMKLPPTALP